MAPESGPRPRVGVPYRTQKEEVAGDRSRYELYVNAVREAAGEPVEISLGLSRLEVRELAKSLDAIVLPGSPADVNPALFGASRHPNCGESDRAREHTDFALLDYAFAESKPVLAICYGNQSLNVFQGGSLVQDIADELQSDIRHDWAGREQGVREPFHPAQIESESRLARLANSSRARVNSSHHQSILKAGNGLRIVARAADDVVEAVEWTGDANWIVGVQWHPERMTDSDPLARALFRELVTAARRVPAQA
jgi:putative glutamine amidotransferase